ncbi:MAG: class I SAM-dependent methyltransferase [Gammaproteobacteria bacterium]|nr:MAG: class I SAM-dependent methyltransferase [Gammaproteobacteria bacterium]
MEQPDTQRKWDALWREQEGPGRPARVLAENAHLLPAAGEALDLACGLGANALLLARRGLRVRAWDLSTVAVERLQAQARAEGLAVAAEVRDVCAQPPPPEAFDVVVVAHFLERPLAPALVAALRPGGLLYFETYTREALSPQGPGRPEWRLAPGELLGLFAPLRPVVYREEGLLGDLGEGWRDKALLVAVKEPARRGGPLPPGWREEPWRQAG